MSFKFIVTFLVILGVYLVGLVIWSLIKRLKKKKFKDKVDDPKDINNNVSKK